MENLILSALIGFTIGTASSMFSRSRHMKARLANIGVTTLGSISLGLVVTLFSVNAPIPAVSVIGALVALMVLIVFRKPDNEHRSYYL